MNNKVKIKTITCHNVYNHGASLQEYALMLYLIKMGYDVETINYKPAYLSNHYNFFSVSNPKWERFLFTKILYVILKFPLRLMGLRRKYYFDKFSKKFIKATKIKYNSNLALKKNIPEADIYICGSDQIWNSFFENGKDPAFYLDFVPKERKKISYAASFAIEKIEENHEDFVRAKVNYLDVISVREVSGVSILNALGISNVVQVVDPVFLFNKRFWNEIAILPIKREIDYILVYDADNNLNIKQFVLKLAKENNYKIISISPRLNYADYDYSHRGPEAFLGLIKNASFIVSNSFHAVAFSIIFQKQFVVYNRGENINTRMHDFLKQLNISNALVSFEAQDYDYYIEYNLLNPILKKLIDSSKDFLYNALKENNDE